MVGKTIALHSLPSFPSSQTLRSLSPSQYASLIDQISSTLLQILSLPNDKLVTQKSYRNFVASYVGDGALEILSTLVFSDGKQQARSSTEVLVRKRVLLLAERLASIPNAGALDLNIILDIAIVYAPKNATRVLKLFEIAIKSNPALLKEIEDSGLPGFQRLLDTANTGLHGLRKTTFCLICLLQSAPPDVLTRFALNKHFVLTVARCYDSRLSSIAASYGGFNFQRADDTGWEKLWIESKVALLDCFHLLFQHILRNVSNDTNVEYAFDLVFALLDLPSTSTPTNGGIPFLNRPLVADYQQAYSLATSLASALANGDDARVDLLDATLKSFDAPSVNVHSRKEGALRLLLRSSGVPPRIDSRGSGKGKAKEAIQEGRRDEVDSTIDLAVSQVLDLFPDQHPSYVRALLALPAYDGNPELVIVALLEGNAPAADTLIHHVTADSLPSIVNDNDQPPKFKYTAERRNVFDDERMDLANITVGKRRTDADTALQDRTFIEQMKADILRRAEEITDDSEEEIEKDQHGQKNRVASFEEELDDDLISGSVNRVSISGDGEESDGGSDGDDADEGTRTPVAPETKLELAYIRDPNLFNRDAATRRSKARADLKAQTGWVDEQIEGWRVMLERNPKKDKILQKHEFAGNVPLVMPSHAGESSSNNGRGRGRGRGRGGGRGGSNQEGGGAKDRAWKDKNKARQANHNRKGGHDRKMARGGGGAPV